MASSRKTPTLCERNTRKLWGTNLIRPFSRDVKDTLLTRKRQLTADSDSKFIRSVVVGLSQGKIISTISSFSSGNQNNPWPRHTFYLHDLSYGCKLVLIINIYEILDGKTIIYRKPLSMEFLISRLVISLSKINNSHRFLATIVTH